MINRLTIILFTILLSQLSLSSLLAQFQPGAKQIALSNSDVAASDDIFSLFGNPAGLSRIESRQFGIFYSPSPFGISELANGYAAINQPTNFGSFALGAMNYGFNLYRETRIQFGYSKIIEEKFLFGISAFYQTLSIKNYGTHNSVNLSLGGIFIVSNNLSIGFSLHNPLRENDYSSLTTNFRTGISYTVLDDAKIHLAVFKEINFPISISGGVEYDILKFFSLRFGIQNNPNTYSAGIGINYLVLQLDYALNSHQDLGLTHQIGLLINFSE